MTNAETASRPAFRWAMIREAPARGLGIVFLLFLRVLFGLFYLGGTVNKFQRDYLFSDYPLQLFTKRLSEIDPDTMTGRYLEGFIIPNAQFVGWVVAWGELAVTIGMLLGLMTRSAGLIAVFLQVNFWLGGYGDASLVPLTLIALLFVVFPTGHWWGLDRRLNQRYPNNWLFK
jgi:thiosulfate dehydrogenase [quinone] large subunit